MTCDGEGRGHWIWDKTMCIPATGGRTKFLKGLQFVILSALFSAPAAAAAKGSVASLETGKVTFWFHCENWAEYSRYFQIHGGLIPAEPENACKPVVSPPSSRLDNGALMDWILLSSGSGCDYATKVLNAQDAGYSAVIIYHSASPSLEDVQLLLNATWESEYVFACYIHQYTGDILLRNYTYGNKYIVNLSNDQNEVNWWFVIVLAMIFAVCLMLFVLCFRFAWYLSLVFWQRLTTLREDFRRIARERRRSKRNKLFAAALKQVPSQKWDPSQLSESCAICVEEFSSDEDLRILNCNHGFHLTCIDEWLINGRRDCPVCKRKVLLENHEMFSNTDSETEDETAPLISHSVSAPQSPPANPSQPPRRENPFMRGTVLHIQQQEEGDMQTSGSSDDSAPAASYSQIP